ncbi:MAG: hypothetical protein ACYDG2_15650 [Ruminiclostridium sp.]
MNRFIVVITNRRKLSICLIAILFIILSAFFISKLNFSKAIETDSSEVKNVLSPENENEQLKDILSSIIPSGNNILFENSNRDVGDSYISNELTNVAPSDILKKGKNLSYIFVYSNEEYLRPIYSNTWKQAYYQGWLYLPRKIISARHSLFTYMGGAGKIFDIEGELGFYPNISIDTQNYINFLIYNFDLQNVIQLENQIVVSGTPTKKGVQIISIKTDDISIRTNEAKQIMVHLCTPTGLEIDYQNVKLAKIPDGKEDFGTVEETFFETVNDISDVNKQNIQLRKELIHYISDSSKPIFFQYNGSYQTSNVLNTNIDLNDAIKLSYDIKYNILYNNEKYISPVFHPQWKEHSDREWCYIPRKMYINMKKLFVLPSDEEVSNDLCGELGFFEEYPSIKKNQVGLLINNFTVSNVSLFEDNILVSGTPSRTGIQVVSIEKTNLTNYKEYAVRLVTKDLCELDIDVIKN